MRFGLCRGHESVVGNMSRSVVSAIFEQTDIFAEARPWLQTDRTNEVIGLEVREHTELLPAIVGEEMLAMATEIAQRPPSRKMLRDVTQTKQSGDHELRVGLRTRTTPRGLVFAVFMQVRIDGDDTFRDASVVTRLAPPVRDRSVDFRTLAA